MLLRRVKLTSRVSIFLRMYVYSINNFPVMIKYIPQSKIAL
jgi:hypothetical protein